MNGKRFRRVMKYKECERDWWKVSERESELLNEKQAGKDVLMSELQILSPMRFNTPFNYQPVHLCKHPHPLLPEPDAQMWTPE